MDFYQQCPLDLNLIRNLLQEVEVEITEKKDPQDKAWLLHQKGTLHGLLGEKILQKNAWHEALLNDPENKMVKESLQSLSC